MGRTAAIRGLDMGDTSLIRTTLLIALLAALGFVAAGRAPAGIDRGYRGPLHGLLRQGGEQLPSALSCGFSHSGGSRQPFCWASACRSLATLVSVGARPDTPAAGMPGRCSPMTSARLSRTRASLRDCEAARRSVASARTRSLASA